MTATSDDAPRKDSIMESRFAVIIGLDVGKTAHHACALDPDGNKLFDKALPQDETKLRELFTQLQNHGEVLMVVDQPNTIRSEEHTSELQSRFDLVCRLLLEKKKNIYNKCY